MKKNLMSWMSVMMMAFVCVGFAACSSDDDNGGSTGGGSLQVNGSTYNFNNAYFQARSASGGKTEYLIQIWNCDYYSALERMDANMLPDEIRSMNIMFTAEGTTDAVPTGSFTPFETLVASVSKSELTTNHGFSRKNQYTSYSENVPVKITKDGDSYTISFDKVDYIDVFAGNDDSVVFSSGFTYTGKLAPLPSELFVED